MRLSYGVRPCGKRRVGKESKGKGEEEKEGWVEEGRERRPIIFNGEKTKKPKQTSRMINKKSIGKCL